MNYTTNFELNKPEGSDFYDIEDHNENMDVIDEAMGDFYEELEDHDDALEYHGELLGEHDKALCRTNLLDNWYLGHAVNQRGQTSWEASYSGVTVDRWKKTGNTLAINYSEGNGITFNKSSSTTDYFYQFLDKTTYDAIKGKKITISVCAWVASPSTDRQLVFSSDGETTSEETVNLQSNITTLTTTVLDLDYPTGSARPYIAIKLNRYGGFTVLAFKLEVGETQTLGKFANGAFILNDVPKYGEQLLRCKRFYQVIAGGVFPGKVFLYSSGNYQLYVCLPLQVDMDESISSVSVSGITGSSFWDLVDGSASAIDGVYKATDAKLGNQNEPRNGCYYVRCSGGIVSSHIEKIGIARGLTVILSTE